jgi:hypothetical protein
VLSVLWRAYPPAPRAFFYSEERTSSARSFFVMERRLGTVVRREVPPEFGGGDDPVANRKLSEVVVDALARLPRRRPRQGGARRPRQADGYLQRQVSGWTQRWERAEDPRDAGGAEVIAWLESHMPASPPATLVHNDWRLDNMAVAADDPGSASPSTTGTCARAVTRSPTSAPCSRRGSRRARSTRSSPRAVARARLHDAAGGGRALRQAERPRREHDAVLLRLRPLQDGVVVQQLYFRWHNGQTKDDRWRSATRSPRAVQPGAHHMERA